jgi:hypothetical protein
MKVRACDLARIKLVMRMIGHLIQAATKTKGRLANAIHFQGKTKKEVKQKIKAEEMDQARLRAIENRPPALRGRVPLFLIVLDQLKYVLRVS